MASALGPGARTHISDDRLWLPYALTHYLEVTGDQAILDEAVPFLQGPPVPQGQEDLYFEPQVSSESTTLFEQVARALEKSLEVGPHRLPLIGSGDWNDGMNRIGQGGQGESVWLGWFLPTNLSGPKPGGGRSGRSSEPSSVQPGRRLVSAGLLR